MTFDPTDPDSIENDTETIEAGTDEELSEVPAEAPEADTAEQHADVTPVSGSPGQGDSYSADEADRAEQARVVELDEDDYR